MIVKQRNTSIDTSPWFSKGKRKGMPTNLMDTFGKHLLKEGSTFDVDYEVEGVDIQKGRKGFSEVNSG